MVKQNLAIKIRPVVKADRLIAAKALQDRLQKLKKQSAEVERLLRPMEAEIIEALEAGAALEPGSPLASVEYLERRIPKYKEELIARIGEDGVAKIIAETPPAVSKKLVIVAKVAS